MPGLLPPLHFTVVSGRFLKNGAVTEEPLHSSLQCWRFCIFSTIEVSLVAISTCHVGIGDKLGGKHPLVCRFMRGACRKLPESRPLVPLWDLLLVQDALSSHSFEPIEVVELKMPSIKKALLMALTMAKRVSHLQTLSVHPSCLQLAPGQAKTHLLD